MRFLILNHHIQDFAGSEINTLQLCQALTAMGHTAEIGAFRYGAPMQGRIEEAGIRVIDLLQDGISALQYDVIWAHHAPVLAQLVFNQPVCDARILFSSLGPLEPLEAPPIFHAAIPLFLVNSRKNQARLVQNGVSEAKIRYFPNFAPVRFFSRSKQHLPGSPTRIAVISNHPPDEVLAFARQAAGPNCQVDLIGVTQQPVFVDEQLLCGYDLVMTIGKTVQYCFALRIPVYCYDWFGGPGYLTRANFPQAEAYNFSGRGFDRQLSAEELYRDIVDTYEGACGGLDFLQSECRSRMCLETNLQALIQEIAGLPITRIGDLRRDQTLAERVYALYIRELKIRYQIGAQYKTLEEQVWWLKSEADRRQQVIDAQQRQLEDQSARVDLLTAQVAEKDSACAALSQAIADEEQSFASVSQTLDDREREIRDIGRSRGWQLVLLKRRLTALVRSWLSRVFGH